MVEECSKVTTGSGLGAYRYNGEVVVSGISCRLPESDNMEEFKDNLLNGVDMVTEDDRRWKPGTYMQREREREREFLCNLEFWL